MTRKVIHRRDCCDSLFIMRLNHELESMLSSGSALVVKADREGMNLLSRWGYQVEGLSGISPDDLLIGLENCTDSDMSSCIDGLPELFERLRRSGSEHLRAASSLAEALVIAPKSNLALISVPGEHAEAQAEAALDAGMNVMLFSDNVSLEAEVSLKDRAARSNRLVMGPDCGTTIIGGTVLGFGNAIKKGPIGVVSTSGTGAQEFCCLLDLSRSGVSHVIGVGSRDLSHAVGARSTLQAIDLLEEDRETQVIVVLAKAASAGSLRRLSARFEIAKKPILLCCLDRSGNSLDFSHASVYSDIDHAVSAALRFDPLSVDRIESIENLDPMEPRLPDVLPTPLEGTLLGLFAGGGLCRQAVSILDGYGLDVRSNAIEEKELSLGELSEEGGHKLIDLGADEFTQGTLHPMIDPRARLRLVHDLIENCNVSLLMIDLIFGHGVVMDPSTGLLQELRDLISSERRTRNPLKVVVSLCGTEGDPHNLTRVREEFSEAGIFTFRNAAAAARYAASLMGGRVDVV